MSAFQTFVNVQLPLRVSYDGEPTANYFPRFIGFATGGLGVEERSPTQVLSDIGGVPTSRSINPTSLGGLFGGGTLAADREFALDIFTLQTATPDIYSDYLAFHDDTAGDGLNRKVLFSDVPIDTAQLSGTIDADTLDTLDSTAFALSATSIDPTSLGGLAGGGTLASDREFKLDIGTLQTATPDNAADYLAFADATAGDGLDRKVLIENLAIAFTQITGTVDADTLGGNAASDFVAVTGDTMTGTLIQSGSPSIVATGAITLSNVQEALVVSYVGASYSQVIIGRSRTGPAAVQSGDVLGELQFRGYGTALSESANILAVATETHSGSQHGTELRFEITQDGSSGPGVVMALAFDASNLTNTLGASSTQNIVLDCSTNETEIVLNSTTGDTCTLLINSSGATVITATNGLTIDATTGTAVLRASGGNLNLDASGFTINFSSDVSFLSNMTVQGDLTVNGSAEITGDLTVGGEINPTTVSNTATDEPTQDYLRARDGGGGTPAAVNSGDSLGIMSFSAHDGTAYGVAGSINVEASQNWTGSAHGADVIFKATPASTTTPQEIFRAGGSAGAAFQLASSVQLLFGGGSVLRILPAGSATLQYDADSGGGHNFNVNLSQEVSIAADAMTFNNGATDTGFAWGTSGQLDVTVGGSVEVSITANEMTFNNGATDTSLYWGSSGQLAFRVGGTTEMILSANTLHFEQGFTDTQFDFATAGTFQITVASADFDFTSTGYIEVPVGYKVGGSTGVAAFGPAAPSSITVKGGIITAIS